MENHYKTPHLMVTMGEDFHYMRAIYDFKNMDELIQG